MPTSRTRINAESRVVVGIGSSTWRALPARMGVTATARMVAVSVFAIDSIVGSLLIESPATQCAALAVGERIRDRKSTRLNSSHSQISYAVFCLKKKKKNE